MNPMDYLTNNYMEYPFEISLETQALCNAACTFCPYPTLERKGKLLSDERITSIIVQMSRFPMPFAFSPFKVNEPFLDPRLISICKAVNEYVPQAALRLFSNGTPLTTNKLLEVAKLRNVEHLWVSLNSHDPVEYEKLMSLPFRIVANRLDDLHNLFLNGDFQHPVTLSKVSTHPATETEFHFYCSTRWPAFNVAIIKQDGWLGYVPPADSRIPNTGCTRWFELSITATGEVALCCMDGKTEFPIGNIADSTLYDIYNHPKWRTRRELMLSRRSVHPCSTCTY
jgi:sulfatase maturation enzyme AslB (radical SAM superfamily)